MKWRKGPPPSIGWWPASYGRNLNALRWWDGEWWSANVSPRRTAKHAARLAKRKAEWQEKIEWTDRPANWPERSKT
jgi:hypothetical protein